MAAISAGMEREGRYQGNLNPTIFLLDSRKKIGAKILVSGGTRCNVTNTKVSELDYQTSSRRFVKQVLQSFTSERTISFFESIGVDLVLEPTGKYFPTTHSGRTVLDALVNETERLKIHRRYGCKVIAIQKKAKHFELKLSTDAGEEVLLVDRVILATGGLSYPETGSDGTGLKIAAALGHKILPTSPALTPFTTMDKDWPSLSGVAFPVKLTCFWDGRSAAEFKGAMLFTHTGFSGPVALDISRFFTNPPKGIKPTIRASFLPDENDDSLRQAFMETPQKNLTLLKFISKRWDLPERWVTVFLKKTKIRPDVSLGQLTIKMRTELIQKLLHYPLEVSGVIGYKKAEVTAGGVDLNEIDPKTMQSKKVPGLYMCGEVLDVDGRIGGFNFQWGWSSGRLAGMSAVRSL